MGRTQVWNSNTTRSGNYIQALGSVCSLALCLFGCCCLPCESMSIPPPRKRRKKPPDFRVFPEVDSGYTNKIKTCNCNFFATYPPVNHSNRKHPFPTETILYTICKHLYMVDFHCYLKSLEVFHLFNQMKPTQGHRLLDWPI